MSEEKVALVRRSVEAVNSGVVSDRTFANLCTPDFWMDNVSSAVTDKLYKGADGVREWVTDFRDAFGDDAQCELQDVIAVGDDFVVSWQRWTGHGGRSGAPLTLRWAAVTWFRDGRMSKVVAYPNRRDALKAVGLEQPVSQDTIEATKRIIERFNRRDLSAWDDEYTTDYEFFPRLMGAVEGQSFRGRQGLERYFDMMDDLFDVWLVAGEEFREMSESVLVRVRIESRGKGGGVPVVGWQSVVIDFREAKVWRVRSFLDEEEALKAVAVDG